MKTLTSSVAFQDESGNLLGSLILTLPTGVYVVASGGGQVVGQSLIVNLDATGKVPGSVTIWASDELSPQTPYSVVLCQQPNGAQAVGTATWFIGGVSPIDLSLMTQTSTGISYSGAVLLNPTAQQTINGQTLNMEGASVGFSAIGSTTPDSFFSRIAAGVIGVGTAIGNALGTIRAAIFQIGGSDTGLTRDAAGVIDAGNGTQGNKSGTIKLTTLSLNKSDGTVPATITNDTTGGVLLTVNGGGQLQLGNSGTLFIGSSSQRGQKAEFFGATSGTTDIQASAVAGSTTLTLPAATGTVATINNAQTWSGNQTNMALVTPTVGTGVSQGSGLKHQRFGASCTTPATAGTACISTYTWTNAFADTNYTVVCQGEGNVGSTAAAFVSSHTASQVQVAVVTFSSVAVSFSEINCIGIHD